jgi:salicylate hydroxylase
MGTHRKPFHVLVVGGGIGGLCLAQGLKRAGVSVAVYERNRVRTDWLQGYRIHISPHGSRALHECLPSDLWDAFLATAGKPTAGFGFLTEQMKDLLFLDRDLIAGPETDSVSSHHSVSRITLRQVLLGGLENLVQYGKEFVRYEQTPDGVTAFFADGTAATGDVLVAADGANSRVRLQYLPHAERIDTGVVAVAGKVPLNEETRRWLPPRLYTTVNNVLPRTGGLMFTAVWEGDRKRADVPAGVGVNSEAGDLRPGMLFDNTQDYVFWAYATKRDRYPVEVDQKGVDGGRLQQIVLEMIEDWAPDLRRLVAASDPTTVAPVWIRSMAPVQAWETSNITLIGDAIHNMTPLAGIGANTALRDASLLCRKLVGVDRGQAALLPSVREYETEMLDYGFKAVKLSLGNARRATSDRGRGVMRALLRVINALPPLKRQFARGFGR